MIDIGEKLVGNGADLFGYLRSVECFTPKLDGISAFDVMRTDIVRASPRDSVEDCLSLMRANRCRHLLVFDRDEFVGIVSLRDLAALMLEEKESLVEELTKYITS